MIAPISGIACTDRRAGVGACIGVGLVAMEGFDDCGSGVVRWKLASKK